MSIDITCFAKLTNCSPRQNDLLKHEGGLLGLQECCARFKVLLFGFLLYQFLVIGLVFPPENQIFTYLLLITACVIYAILQK